jgi:hypothetical protein
MCLVRPELIRASACQLLPDIVSRSCYSLMSPIVFIPVLYAAGLGCFWLFYKSVDFFDHI